LGRMLIHGFIPQFVLLVFLIFILFIALGITALATPTTRTWLFEKITKAKLAYIR
jgi:hypothetical protein